MNKAVTVRTVKRTHHVEYTWLDRETGVRKDGRFHTLVDSAEACLTEFHRAMQRTHELGADRHVVRSKLAPADYRITRLYATHQKGDNLERAVGDYVADDYPVPPTDNPDVSARPDATPTIETEPMPFFAETLGKKPTEEQ